MARLCPLFSSSSGNSTFIDTPNGGFLIDAGVSFKRLKAALETAGGSLSDLRAVLVTHEHSDHINGLKMLLKTAKIPLIASEKTLDSLAKTEQIPVGATVLPIGETALSLADVDILHIPTSHDCAGSGGYALTLPDGRRIAVCTDSGVVTDGMKQILPGCDAVLLESNHDVMMLKNGPYPPQLKLRILSDLGHLSNNACAEMLPMLLQSGTTRFVLGHLSQKNNLPMLALSAAKATLAEIGAEKGKDYLLSVARPADNEVTLL